MHSRQPWFASAVLLALLLGMHGPAAAQFKQETCQVVDPELKEFYYGPCQDGFAHGEGQARGTASYRGEFKAGRKHGKGLKIWPNGDSYSGDFVEDRKHGRGTYSWGRGRNEGERYVGDYRDDRRDGQGTYRWPNGDVYEGPWAADRMTNENAPVLRARASALQSGPYFGVLLGRSNMKDACAIAPCDDKSAAYGMFAGYQFNGNFSLEAGIHDLGEFVYGGSKLQAGVVDLAVIAALPFGRYSPYLKAGVYKGEFSGPAGNEDPVNAALGGGLQYDLPYYAFRVEYMYYRRMGGTDAGLETGVDRISFGLVLKFR